jgi:hypothetical protein
MKIKTINLEYTNIPVLLEPLDFFINKIQNDEIFHFYKINHGMLDSLWYAYKNDYNTLQNLILKKNYSIIAEKIYETFNNAEWGLNYWHEDIDKCKLLNYLEIFIKVVAETGNINSKILSGLSLGVGLGTHWGVYEQNHPMQMGRIEIAKVLINVNNNDFYYSGLFKHYTIKKEIFKLFNLLNELDFEVVFLGPDYLRLYKDVFKINKFHHINIPVRGAASNFGHYINQLKDIISNTNNKTIVLHSAGQMLSANLLYELKDTDIWGIDIGRSFDILIKNKLDSEPTMYKCWTGLDLYGLNKYVDDVRADKDFSNRI